LDYAEIKQLLINAIKSRLKKQPDEEIINDVMLGATELKLKGRIEQAVFMPEKNLEAIGFKKDYASELAEIITDFALRANRKILLTEVEEIVADYQVNILKDGRVKVTRTVNLMPKKDETKAFRAKADEYREHVLKEIEEGHYYPERVRKFLGV
jgi:hypothetical protein